MTEFHLPKFDRKSIGKIILEVVLISLGVFLGLMGERWREHRQHLELAETSLERFRVEILTNQKAVLAVKDYHTRIETSLEQYFAADSNARKAVLDKVSIQGLKPAMYEHTAWDLAIATQALTYLDPKLAFELSRLYSAQNDYALLTTGVLNAVYLRPPTENLEAFLRIVAVYYGDIVLMEPKILSMYDEILPQIDKALGK